MAAPTPATPPTPDAPAASPGPAPSDRAALPTMPRIPSSTYRLQFNPSFRFTDARAIVPYLHRLGVGDLYASPLFAATPGSTHGYDVTDPTRLNPELGTGDDFSALADDLASSAMGLLLDIVPNHMAAHHDNPWWWDLLESGEASAYAAFFDVRWDEDPLRRLILPVLGAPLDEVLARHELTLGLDARRGIVLRYFDRLLPLDPAHWSIVLLPHAADLTAILGESSPGAAALTRLLARSGPLPSRIERDLARRAERRSAIEQIKADLRSVLDADPASGILLAGALAAASRPEDSDVLSPIASILDRQPYRLEHWKTGLARINYRRFFDISDLASLSAERPQVFDAAHSLVRALVDRGSVTGLRIDHIDGLADPLAYLRRLRELVGAETYLVVEKILAHNETFPPDWPVEGTTGYDALNALSHIFVEPRGLEALQAHAARSLGLRSTFADTAFASKALAISTLFPSELRALAAELAPLAAQRGAAASPDDLADALAAVTAALDVYRTYTRDTGPSGGDRARIERALDTARRRDGAHGPLLDVLRDILLPGPGAGDDQLAFIRRWQQFTGPVMAKGVEDTALYRHITLASLNEVGGEPAIPADPVRALHDFNLAAASGAPRRPHSLFATSTHDTKRSEDARARLHVLSEIPDRWTAALDRWREINAPCKRSIGGRPAPSDTAESLIYQSLIAMWPLQTAAGESLTTRLQAAMIKSAREAKLETSWSEPRADYESALISFIAAILGGRTGSPFLPELLALVRDIAPAAAMNSLSQLTLKLSAPGVPDIYQGTELWDLSLVDPDNRRPVDFAARSAALADIEQRAGPDTPALVAELLRTWRDGRIKLYTLWRALHARREHPELFTHGDYLPLAPAGPAATHIVAFARRHTDQWAIAIAPRLTYALPRDRSSPFPLGPATWTTTSLSLPDDAPTTWRNILTGETIATPDRTLSLAATLRTHPTSILLSTQP